MAKKKCESCGKEAMSGLRVFDTDGRLYLPTKKTMKFYKEAGKRGPGTLRYLDLCHPCMRYVEDNFRASVAYMLAEKGPKFRK